MQWTPVTRRILQICPHDAVPFGDLCSRYEQAAVSLDAEITTAFLSTAAATPLPFARYLNNPDLADTRTLRASLEPLAEQPWDLVICHRYRSYWAVTRSAVTARRVVAVAHEYGLLNRWQRRINRALFARQVEFAGVSAGVADELRRITGAASVLPNVVDVAAAQSQLLSKSAALAELGLEPGPFTVGMVGRLHYKKRPRFAYRAFTEFARATPGARMVFLGDGEERAQLEQDIGDNVHLLGNVPVAARTFAAFDALLHTPQIEAFGMVALEALLAGVPVVALPQHGPEFVLGDLGVYAQADTPGAFAQALQAAQNIDRKHLLAQGQKRVRQLFSVSALARSLDDLLKD